MHRLLVFGLTVCAVSAQLTSSATNAEPFIVQAETGKFTGIIDRHSCWHNVIIGYPKLFTGGAVGRQESPAAPPVNNFVAAQTATRLGWPCGFICGYPVCWFSRPGGSGLLTTSRRNDFELMDRPAGRGLTL